MLTKFISALALFATIIVASKFEVRELQLEAVVVGKLPSPREDTAAFYDGDDSIFILGGSDALNLYDDILRFNLSGHGRIEDVSYFGVGLAEGSVGSDAHGFYHFGGESNSDIWKLTAANPNPSIIGHLPTNSRLHCTASGNDKIYIVGGAEGNIKPKNSILEFDSTTGTTKEIAQLPVTLYGMACAWFGDSVYIFGGVSDGKYSNDIYIFSPSTTSVRKLDVPFHHNQVAFANAVATSEYIYIVGGVTPDFSFHHVTMFNPDNHVKEPFHIPTHQVFAGSSTVYIPKSNRIYVAGGYTFKNERIQRLDEIFYLQLGQPQ